MITGHIINSCGLIESRFYVLGNHTLPFFMPWFFFKSGMLYKGKVDFSTLLMRGGVRLFVPYSVFCIGSFILFDLGSLSNNGFGGCLKSFFYQLYYTGAPSHNVALWFLLTLFLVKLIFSLLIRHINSSWVSFIAGILSVVVFMVYHHTCILANYKLPYYFMNAITGLFFYACGVLLKDLQFTKHVIITSLIIHCIILMFCFSFVDMFKNDLLQGSYVFWLLSSITGCVIINNIFRKLSKNIDSPLLNYIGRNSMTFLLIHLWLIIIIKGRLLPLLQVYNPYYCFILIVIACIIALPIANWILHTKYLKWMIGE